MSKPWSVGGFHLLGQMHTLTQIFQEHCLLLKHRAVLLKWKSPTKHKFAPPPPLLLHPWLSISCWCFIRRTIFGRLWKIAFCFNNHTNEYLIKIFWFVFITNLQFSSKKVIILFTVQVLLVILFLTLLEACM